MLQMPSSTRRTRRLSDADISYLTTPIINISNRIVNIFAYVFVFIALYIIILLLGVS
jgi:hypothetical protein